MGQEKEKLENFKDLSLEGQRAIVKYLEFLQGKHNIQEEKKQRGSKDDEKKR